MREITSLDKSIAHARREDFYTASGRTSRELRAGIDSYRQAVGGEAPAGSAEECQIRMIRRVLRRRVMSTSSRTRAQRASSGLHAPRTSALCCEN